MPRLCWSEADRAGHCRLRTIGALFALTGLASCLAQGLHWSLGNDWLFLSGGVLFVAQGAIVVASTVCNKDFVVILSLTLSVFSTLYAMAWIMAFQVVLATKTAPGLQQRGKDLGMAFSYVLAAQYLLAGMGAVLGVLSAAFSAAMLKQRAHRSEAGDARAAVEMSAVNCDATHSVVRASTTLTSAEEADRDSPTHAVAAGQEC